MDRAGGFSARGREFGMRAFLALGLALGLAGEAGAAEQVMPFASHRAAYMITLAKGEAPSRRSALRG